MTRYTLHVPRKTNDGAIIEYRELERIENALLDIAGGFTSEHGVGAWRSPDTDITYREPVQLYHVDSNADDVERELRWLAQDVAGRLAQEAVYLTSQPIGVELITPARVEVAA